MARVGIVVFNMTGGNESYWILEIFLPDFLLKTGMPEPIVSQIISPFSYGKCTAQSGFVKAPLTTIEEEVCKIFPKP